MGNRDLADTYIHPCPQACGPQAQVYSYIMQICLAHVIKTHGSESRGQEEAGLHDERVSYLQVAPL